MKKEVEKWKQAEWLKSRKMVKDEGLLMNDEGWMMKAEGFKLLRGFDDGLTDKLMDGVQQRIILICI